MLKTEDLERLIETAGDRAFSFALGLCGSKTAAAEAVQEAFTRMLDNAERYDPAVPLESLFLTIVRNACYDQNRQWERRNCVSLDAPVGDDGLTVADAVADANEEALLDRLERAESVELLQAALAELQPDFRTVVTLIDIEGMGYEEAAAALGWPPGTVRSRLFRAREALRLRLIRQGVTS